MTTKNRLADCGVSRRDMMRIGAGGLGFGLFGGTRPGAVRLQQGERSRGAPTRARSSWSSSGSAATTA